MEKWGMLWACKAKFLLLVSNQNVKVLLIIYSLISVVSRYSKASIPNQFLLTEFLWFRKILCWRRKKVCFIYDNSSRIRIKPICLVVYNMLSFWAQSLFLCHLLHMPFYKAAWIFQRSHSVHNHKRITKIILLYAALLFFPAHLSTGR